MSETAYTQGFLAGMTWQEDRILTILNGLSFAWYGDKQNLELGKDQLLALIKEEK